MINIYDHEIPALMDFRYMQTIRVVLQTLSGILL